MPLAKATQRDITILAKLYLEARERLLNTILNPNVGVGTKVYSNSILRHLTRELNSLRKASTEFINADIPREYREGLRDIYTYFKRNKLMMRAPEHFAHIHTDALHEIAREMQFQIDSGLQTVGRQVMRYVDIAWDDALRQAGLKQTGIKIASGGTVRDMRASMIRQLQESGFLTVQYGSGDTMRQVPVDVYASMVARSTSREAGNTARLNQLTTNGYDLVQMTKHYPTCDVCAPLQDRVYSISGADKRFPPLSMAFGAYNNVHPNCRHSVHPWIESMHTDTEVRVAIARSNAPFEDNRSAGEKALYKSQQDDARRMRNDVYQWERYRAALGDDAPKSVAEFRRIKDADGEQWKLMQLDYRRRHLHGNPKPE